MKLNTIQTAAIREALKSYTAIESAFDTYAGKIAKFLESVAEVLTFAEAGKAFADEAKKIGLESYCADHGFTRTTANAFRFCLTEADRKDAGDFLRGMGTVSSARVSQILNDVYGKSGSKRGRKPQSAIERIISEINKLPKLSAADAKAIAKALEAKLA